MARFRYRMQNVLNIKEQLETQEKQNFAMMRIRLNEEEEKLDALVARKNHIDEEAVRMRQNSISVLELKENEALRKFIEEQIKGQQLKVRAAEKNLENARNRMQKAISERKIHEKLREHAFEAFVKEENMKEAKEIDELTSYTYGQKTQQ